jgi:hypothetical protein
MLGCTFTELPSVAADLENAQDEQKRWRRNKKSERGERGQPLSDSQPGS